MMRRWEGTPYEPFGVTPGKDGGVDCVRFVLLAVTEIEGMDPPAVERFPADGALHDPAGARKVMRRMLRLFPSYVRVYPGTDPDWALRSGCVCAVRNEDAAGPGHGLIATTTPGVLMHATPKGVMKVGTAALRYLEAVYDHR